jgi:hypothetical protein
MTMSRTSASVLAGCLILAVAVSAGAGIPDPDASYVTMTDGGKGLTTCPAGDAGTYSYITVTALRTDLTPIVGILAADFHFTVTGSGSGNVSISAYDTETDINGEIRFEASSSGAIVYGSLTISVQIYTVLLVDTGTLWCNTYDYDESGVVNPIDFGRFALDFITYNERSDFDWNGVVSPIDFGLFAQHFGHF